jgi:hypothetical protein
MQNSNDKCRPTCRLRGIRCHPEPVRFAQGKLREGSAVLDRGELMQILRFAQNDRLSRELQPYPLFFPASFPIMEICSHVTISV